MKQGKLTKAKLVWHLKYEYWKYICAILIVAIGCHMTVLLTRPRVPDEQQLNVYYAGPSEAYDQVIMFGEEIKSAFPQLQEVNVNVILYSGANDFRGHQQGGIYLGAGMGDVYIVHQDFFNSFASSSQQDFWKPLNDAIDSGQIALPEGLDLDKGHVGANAVLEMGLSLDEATEQQKAGKEPDETTLSPGIPAFEEDTVRGIPLDSLTGLKAAAGIDPADMVVVIPYFAEKDEMVYEFISYLFENYR